MKSQQALIKTIHISGYLTLLLICSSCSTPHRIARNNGAKIYRYSYENIPIAEETQWGDQIEWSGGKDEKGAAMGKGVETEYASDGSIIAETEVEYIVGLRHGPYIFRNLKSGTARYEVHGTYNYGRKTGEVELTYIARNNGARIIQQAKLGDDVENFIWTGSKDENGYAHGKGIETWYNQNGIEVARKTTAYANGLMHGFYNGITYDSYGRLKGEGSGRYENGVPIGVHKSQNFDGSSDVVRSVHNYDDAGQWDGKIIVEYKTGRYAVYNYSNGKYISSSEYNADGTPVYQASSSSGFSDTEILGTMLAFAGASGGDAVVSSAGLSMMSGDDMGAIKMLTEDAMAKDTSYSNDYGQHDETTQNGRISSESDTSSQPKLNEYKKPEQPVRKPANKPNLIDAYGLGKWRNTNDSAQLSSYINTADSAYRQYKLTGETIYYAQHEEAAAYAQQFNKITTTQGTRIGN